MDSIDRAGSTALGCGFDVEVREVGTSDLPKLLDHRNHPSTNLWLGRTGAIDAEQHHQWYEKLARRPENCYLIASIDGVDVGLIRITEMWDGCAVVGADLFVEYRGKRLGRSLFEKACDEARRRGAKRELTLWVFVDNEPAIKIYRSCGFVIDDNEEVKFLWRLGRPRAYVLMRKVLT